VSRLGELKGKSSTRGCFFALRHGMSIGDDIRVDVNFYIKVRRLGFQGAGACTENQVERLAHLQMM